MQGKPGRAAVLHQRGDLMPVDVPGNSFGQRRGDSQPGELCYAPVMHERAVANDLISIACLVDFIDIPVQ